MASNSWQEHHAERRVEAAEALAHVRDGQSIFIGSGAGEPQLLTTALVAQAEQFRDLEIFHLAPVPEPSRFARPDLVPYFRVNTFYAGTCSPEGVPSAQTDYTPMRLGELPAAIQSGLLRVDVALIQISPPDAYGRCSLGVSVDATRAAVESASIVIAQVNDQMPTAMGDASISVERVHFLVEGSAPLVEVRTPDLDPVSLTIGRHVASLVEDGTTLHFDRGPIGAATMRYLDTKRNLGLHTDILTDDLLRLIRSGAITNRMKGCHRGKSIATMAIGSRDLYEALDGNPHIELHPVERACDPLEIGRNERMVSVLAIQEIELTGLSRADAEYAGSYGGVPSQMDFLDGARRSHRGFTVLALPSTTADGTRSRIVGHSTSRGVAFHRTSVDYVVTEYGIVHVHGLSIRERAVALISIAHPQFRAELLEEARRLGYVDIQQRIPAEQGGVYPHQYEFTHRFPDGAEVYFRPVQPADARRLQRLFYSLSSEAVRLRYHGTIRAMPYAEALKLATVDYSQDMAIVGLVGPRHNPEAIAEGRYLLNPSTGMGEFDIVVRDDFTGHGIGTFLANYLNKVAFARGLSGVYADVIQDNAATLALLRRAWPTAKTTWDGGTCRFTLRFPTEDVTRPKDSVIVYSGRFADFSYGDDHPFSPARARLALQLIRSQGYLNEPWMRVEEPRLVARERLNESHAPDYIDALEQANDGVWRESFLPYHLGGEECPVFRGMFDYVLLYTSATITGVDLITEENANIVFNPAGGFHHAGRAHAEGFSYVNDAIVAIDLLLARGYRVAYLDIDAHHGNGVQDAYYGDDRVLTVSLHESGKTLYPWSGFETEIGEGIGEGFTINVPLPAGTDDEAYGRAFRRIVPPAVKAFRPNVVVTVVGADMHRSDPLAHLQLTNNGMVYAMEIMRDFSHQMLMLGGGGYDLTATARAWCRLWAAANRVDDLPDYMLVGGGAFLGGSELQGAEVVDMTYRVAGPEKVKALAEVDRIASWHEAHTLPLLQRRLGAIDAPEDAAPPGA